MKHQDIPIGYRHPIHNFQYADSTARLAASGFSEDDLYKIALQLSDFTLWIVTDVDEFGDPTWQAAGGGASGWDGSFINSLEEDGSGDAQLVGDQSSPGNSKYYGTDGAGTKGFHDLPSPGVGGSGSLTIDRFFPIDNRPPVTNHAAFFAQNQIDVLIFPDNASNYAIFNGIVKEGASLAVGIKVRMLVKSVAQTTGDFVMSAQFERGNTTLNSDSFATAKSVTGAVSGTAGVGVWVEIDFADTEIDGLAVGEFYRIQIYREPTHGSDNLSGDLQLVAVELRERTA